MRDIQEGIRRNQAQIKKLKDEIYLIPEKGAQDVLPGPKTYKLAIRDTIGLRKQPKPPQDIVPAIAECASYPRDISLYF